MYKPCYSGPFSPSDSKLLSLSAYTPPRGFSTSSLLRSTLVHYASTRIRARPHLHTRIHARIHACTHIHLKDEKLVLGVTKLF